MAGKNRQKPRNRKRLIARTLLPPHIAGKEGSQRSEIEGELVHSSSVAVESEIEDEPVTVAVDSEGTSVHRTDPKIWQAKIGRSLVVESA